MTTLSDRIWALDVPKILKTDHPMVHEFSFVPQNYTKSTSVHADEWEYGEDTYHFSLKILLKPGVRYLQQRNKAGVRIQPVERVTTGQEVVGQGNRVLTLKDGEIVAENSTFFPNQEFNDLGIGSALYVAQERFYRALGVRYVRLYAASVGRYLWARQGFKFLDRQNVTKLGNQFRQFLQGCELPVRGSFRESWDLVNYSVPGGERNGDRIGKFFALQTFPAWEGFKYLDEQDHNKVAIASREETFARLPSKIPGAPKTLATF